MKVLVAGTGAIGSYFGGRFQEAKQDVTFLVRPQRAAALASAGLIIRNCFGNVSIAAPHDCVTTYFHLKEYEARRVRENKGQEYAA